MRHFSPLLFVVTLTLATVSSTTDARASPITFEMDFVMRSFGGLMTFPDDSPAHVRVTIDSDAQNQCPSGSPSGFFGGISGTLLFLGQSSTSSFGFIEANPPACLPDGPSRSTALFLLRFSTNIVADGNVPIGLATVAFPGPYDGRPPTQLPMSGELILSLPGITAPSAIGRMTAARLVPEPNLLLLTGVGIVATVIAKKRSGRPRSEAPLRRGLRASRVSGI